MMQVDLRYTTDQWLKELPLSCMISPLFNPGNSILRRWFKDEISPRFHGSHKHRQTGEGQSDDIRSVAFLLASNDRILMLLRVAMGAGEGRVDIHIQEQIHH